MGFDESPVPLTRATRGPLPVRPGQPEGDDYAYPREGTANRVLFVPPLRGWRHVHVTARRTPQDFARQMQRRVDGSFPTADRVRWGVDHLKTPTPAARSETFPPTEARRITRTLEFHSTPQQGRGLNRAECELAVLATQGLDRRIPDIGTLRTEIAAWQLPRHPHQATIHGPGGPDVARVKLPRLSLPVEQPENTRAPEAS